MASRARTQLQRRLDAINAGQDDVGRGAIERLASGEPYTLPWHHRPTLRREGAQLLLDWHTPTATDARMRDLVRLVQQVGIDRVRQCRLDGCGKWFVARKRQLWCSTEHGNRASYLVWKRKHTKRGRVERGRSSDR